MGEGREECWQADFSILLSIHSQLMTEKCQRIVEPRVIITDPSMTEKWWVSWGGPRGHVKHPNHPKMADKATSWTA